MDNYLCQQPIHSFFHSSTCIAPLQVCHYSEALPTQHGVYARVSPRSATGQCELRTCPRALAYVAARAGFEPTTLQSTAGFDFTNAPPCSTVEVVEDPHFDNGAGCCGAAFLESAFARAETLASVSHQIQLPVFSLESKNRTYSHPKPEVWTYIFTHL